MFENVSLKDFIANAQRMLIQSFCLMKKNDGYDYLLNRYLFQVDSYDAGFKHRLRLRAIGSRATHNVNIITVPNNAYLLANIDPRDLVELGYRLYFSSKCHQILEQAVGGTWRQISDFCYRVNELIKSYFRQKLEHRNIKNSYPYSLAETSYLDDDVALTLYVKTTGLMLDILLSELRKDLLLASQLEPRHLIKLGYEMAEHKISETFWNQYGKLPN